MPSPSFQGLRVLSFESRRAKEVASLITTYGGTPLSAPALREIPLGANPRAVEFAENVIADRFDIVIFLTGVGARALLEVVDHAGLREPFLAGLGRTRIVARGPKPLAVLRELHLPAWATAPEPNTWRELLAALDEKQAEQPLKGARVGLQEYGVSNDPLLDGLRARGCLVSAVPVYRWALPEDVEPLKEAARSLARGDIDVTMFTTAVQVDHLWQMAKALALEQEVQQGLGRTVIASIGPSTSEAIAGRGLTVDLEASRPKMGFLVREAAEQAAGLLSGETDVAALASATMREPSRDAGSVAAPVLSKEDSCTGSGLIVESQSPSSWRVC